MTDTLLWDLTETARQLGGVSTRTVRRLIDAGDIVPKRVGRRLLVRAASVLAYLDRDMTHAHNPMCAGPDARSTLEERTCQDSARRETKTGYSGGRTRLTGGHRTPRQAASELAAVLALPIGGKPRRS